LSFLQSVFRGQITFFVTGIYFSGRAGTVSTGGGGFPGDGGTYSGGMLKKSFTITGVLTNGSIQKVRETFRR